MATRSTIAIQNEDGTVTGIYSHWDGYLSCNGAILNENYTTEEAVRELISGGDISSLGERIHPDPNTEHNFSHSQEGVTVYYARDRGEQDVAPQTHRSWNDLIDAFGQEFDYLFVPGEGWRVRYYSEWGDVEGSLADELVRDAEAA